MRNKSLIRVAAISMAAVMAFSPVSVSAATLLKIGSRGTEVKMVQTTLKELGYYTYPKTTGYYGKVTEAAVKRFQRANGISADGIIGKKTRGFLNAKPESISFTNRAILTASVKKSDDTAKAIVTNTEIKKTQYSGALDWYKEVNDIWVKGTNAIVTDVDTGKSFEVKRTYGSNHADVEPLTKEDTNIIKDIWGGFGWERRAVVVQIGEYTLAGSMTAMPHAGVDSKPADRYVSGRSDGYGWGYNLDKVKNNGASGVMDIHFKNSRTHSTNTMQKSQQDMVKKAAGYIKELNTQS